MKTVRNVRIVWTSYYAVEVLATANEWAVYLTFELRKYHNDFWYGVTQIAATQYPLIVVRISNVSRGSRVKYLNGSECGGNFENTSQYVPTINRTFYNIVATPVFERMASVQMKIQSETNRSVLVNTRYSCCLCLANYNIRSEHGLRAVPRHFSVSFALSFGN